MVRLQFTLPGVRAVSLFFRKARIRFDHCRKNCRTFFCGSQAQRNNICSTNTEVYPAFRQEEIVLRPGLPVTSQRVTVQIEKTVAVRVQNADATAPTRRDSAKATQISSDTRSARNRRCGKDSRPIAIVFQCLSSKSGRHHCCSTPAGEPMPSATAAPSARRAKAGKAMPPPPPSFLTMTAMTLWPGCNCFVTSKEYGRDQSVVLPTFFPFT